MGIVFRQSAKSTIVIFSGALLGAAINFIYTFVFDKAELGLITNLNNQAYVIQVVLLMGIAYLLMTHFARYDEHDPRRKVLLTISLILPVFTMLVFTVIYIIFREKIVAIYQPADRIYIDRYYYWLPVIVFGWTYTTLFDHYLIARMKTAVGAVVREIVLRVSMLVLIGLFYFRLIDFKVFVALLSFAYVLPAVISLLVSSRTSGFGLSFNFKAFTKAEYKKLFHLSWYYMLEGVSVSLMGYIDSLMLAPLSGDGMSSLSVYRNALYIATVLIMPFRAVSLAAFPVINEAFIGEDREKLKNLFQRTCLNILIVSVCMFVVIACNLDNAVAVFPPGYEQIKPIALILMAGKLVQMAAGMSSEVISFSKYFRFNFRMSAVLLVLVIVLNRIFIPQYGVMGAAWGVTLALTVYSLAKIILLWKYMNLSPFSRHSLYVVIAGALAGIAGWLFPFVIHPVADALLRSAVIVAIFTATLLWLSPDADFSTYIRSVIRRKRLF